MHLRASGRAARRAAVTGPLLLLAMAGLVAVGGPAQAHAELVSTSPTDQQTLSEAPTRVQLTFDEPVSTEFSEIVVTGPDGLPHQDGSATFSGVTVTQALGLLPTAGRYDVAWRVVSDDGHPVTGALSFTVTSGSPVASSDPTLSGPARSASDAAGATSATGIGDGATSPVADEARSGGTSPLLLVGMLLAVAVVLGGGALVVGRRGAGGHD